MSLSEPNVMGLNSSPLSFCGSRRVTVIVSCISSSIVFLTISSISFFMFLGRVTEGFVLFPGRFQSLIVNWQSTSRPSFGSTMVLNSFFYSSSLMVFAVLKSSELNIRDVSMKSFCSFLFSFLISFPDKIVRGLKLSGSLTTSFLPRLFFVYLLVHNC